MVVLKFILHFCVQLRPVVVSYDLLLKVFQLVATLCGNMYVPPC